MLNNSKSVAQAICLSALSFSSCDNEDTLRDPTLTPSQPEASSPLFYERQGEIFEIPMAKVRRAVGEANAARFLESNFGGRIDATLLEALQTLSSTEFSEPLLALPDRWDNQVRGQLEDRLSNLRVRNVPERVIAHVARLNVVYNAWAAAGNAAPETFEDLYNSEPAKAAASAPWGALSPSGSTLGNARDYLEGLIRALKVSKVATLEKNPRLDRDFLFSENGFKDDAAAIMDDYLHLRYGVAVK
jgi:hypothetical protein